MNPHTPPIYRPSPLRAATSASLSSSASARSESPDHEKVQGERVARVQDEEDGDRDVREYEEKRSRMTNAVEHSIHLISDIRNFNEREWDVRYPLLSPFTGGAAAGEGSSTDKGKGKAKELPQRPGFTHRPLTMTFPDAPTTPHALSLSLPTPAPPPTSSLSAATSTPEISHHIDSAAAINSAAAVTGRQGAAHAERRGMGRSQTLLPGSMSTLRALGGPGARQAEEEQGEEVGFSILRLDISMGHQQPASDVMSTLTRSSISTLLNHTLLASLSHLRLLSTRIASTSSRVLVTGDLNAGKSTLVNALLRRGDEVMPVDQQPLTGRFVEVFGDEEIGTLRGVEGGRREEVHVPRVGWEEEHAAAEAAATEAAAGPAEVARDTEKTRKQLIYDRDRAETYEKKELDDLYELVLDQEATSPPLKVYLRAPPQLPNTPPSILHNGILDISLIDAPGLNRDVLQTTSNFASSSSIDVIVFVVSAANHFTLSAKEFFFAAGQEKARMFVVVNRFDEVRDKERCRRTILEQVKKLSPGTWEDREELVHFVDSAKVAYGCCEVPEGVDFPGEGSGGGGGGGGGDDDEEGEGEETMDEAFKKLEHSLRSFVLINRAKSKLGPAENYLTSLLNDLAVLAGANSHIAGVERDAARRELETLRPVLQEMERMKSGLKDGLDEVEDEVAGAAGEDTRAVLREALERVGRGELAVENGQGRVWMPTYPGLLGVWDYAVEVRKAMLRSIEMAVRKAEDTARARTVVGLKAVKELGELHLPEDTPKSERIFRPEVMFTGFTPRTSRPQTPTGELKRMQLQRIKSSYVGTIGLGLTKRPELAQASISDIFDIHTYVSSFKFPGTDKSSPSSADMELSLLGVGSLAGGALAFGGKAMGIGAAFQNLKHVTDFLDSESARKYAAPVTGAVVLGLLAYIVYDLPRSVPKNIGRHIRAVLLEAETQSAGEGEYTARQVERVSRETRKVLRMANVDVSERFHRAMETRGKAVHEGEELEKKSQKAFKWFNEVGERVEGIRAEMGPSVLL